MALGRTRRRTGSFADDDPEEEEDDDDYDYDEDEDEDGDDRRGRWSDDEGSDDDY